MPEIENPGNIGDNRWHLRAPPGEARRVSPQAELQVRHRIRYYSSHIQPRKDRTFIAKCVGTAHEVKFERTIRVGDVCAWRAADDRSVIES